MKKLLPLLLVAGGLIIAGVGVKKYITHRKEAAAAKAEGYTRVTPTCKCYCSDMCGPRDNFKSTDKPFIDPATGICFCQQRDYDNYVKNGCDKKSSEPTTCCAAQQ